MSILSYRRISALLVSSFLVACGTDSIRNQQGQIRLQVAWPAPTFQVAAIPPNTQQLHLQVRSAQAQLEIEDQLTRQTEGAAQIYTLSVGAKEIVLLALDAQGRTLAEARQRVHILPNQTTQAILELKTSSELEPTPTDTASSPEPTAPSGSAPPSPQPTPSTDPIKPSAPSEPEPTPTPTPSPQSGSSGGGSGSGSGGGNSGGSSGGENTPKTTAPTLEALFFDPNVLSGAGFIARLEATFIDPDHVLQPAHLHWSCLDNDDQPCPAPQPESLGIAYWTAPIPANGPYRFVLRVETGQHPAIEESSDILYVDSGSGEVTLSPTTGMDGI